MIPIVGIIGALIIVGVIFNGLIFNIGKGGTETREENFVNQVLTQDVKIDANGNKYLIPIEKIRFVLPPDAIPSIDNPKFLSPEEALKNYGGEEIVIGVSYKGISKAYPLSILVWHEIVNDKFGDAPIAVTYCPLCYSSLGFIRIVENNEVQFGVSGRLYNSDLVMYDRETKSLWSQILGTAIYGERSGYVLKRIPVDVMSLREWLNIYPESLVLSQETGFFRAYGEDPYYGYYEARDIYFPIENFDERLHPKEIVTAVKVGKETKAYIIKNLEGKVIQDKLGGKDIVILKIGKHAARVYEREVDGKVLDFELKDGKLIDKQTGSVWNPFGFAVEGKLKGKSLKWVDSHTTFWFAWTAFHPDTGVYS